MASCTHDDCQRLIQTAEDCIPAVQRLWARRGENPDLVDGATIVLVTRYLDRIAVEVLAYDAAHPPEQLGTSPEGAGYIAAALAEPDTIPVVACYSPALAVLLGFDRLVAVSAPLP